MTIDIETLAARSDQLLEAMLAVLEEPDGYQTCDTSPRAEASAAASDLALEHGSALRQLLLTGHPNTGTALLRLQYEAVVRSAWLLYAATEREVDVAQAELTQESERKANNLPILSVMLKELEAKGPSHLHADLVEVKTMFNKALNSYVHAGIHALSRKQRGYPLPLACQVIQSSNGIGTMAAMMLANLTGEDSKGDDINRLIPSFGDCLPQLHRRPGKAP